MAKTDLTAQRLRELLHYDPETGAFTWRVAAAGCRKIGRAAGNSDTYGYRQVTIDGVRHLAHRLAWLYVYSEWPEKQIDHINRTKHDNRISNLREASISENQQNVAIRKDSKSGVRGVYFHRSVGKWAANISHHGRRKYLGCFESIDEAAAAYANAAKGLHALNPYSSLSRE